jgi:hypothetical protein
MTIDELIGAANDLGIEHYNECDEYLCLKGINGHASLLYTDFHVKKQSEHMKKYCLPLYLGKDIYFYIQKAETEVATMESFARHLKQMGRDSLKMDLSRLLNITSHA